MSEYRCHKCETIHTTENMVAFCAACYRAEHCSCGHEIYSKPCKTIAAMDGEIRELKRKLELQKEDNRHLADQINITVLANRELRAALSALQPTKEDK